MAKKISLPGEDKKTDKPMTDQEQIVYLKQRFSSMVMRGNYKECFKLIEENIRLLYHKERWPESFLSSLRIHRKCYASADIPQNYDEYLPALLKKNSIPEIFAFFVKGPDAAITWTGEYFKGLALAAQSNGDLQQAQDYCDIYIKMEPNNSNGFLLKGWILEAQDKNSEALVAFEQSLELNKTNYQAQLSIAKQYVKTNSKKAIEYIDKALELAPSDPRIIAAKGEILIKAGDLNAALACYEQAIAIDPINVNYPFEKGEILLAQGQTLAALRQYSIAISLNAKHLPSLTRLANISAKDQPELALPHINAVCAIEPNNISANLLRGELLYRTGDYIMATKVYNKILDQDENCEEAYAVLGKLYLQEYPDKALQNFDAALAINASNSDYHFGKGQALERLEDFEQAIVEYHKTVSLNKHKGEAWGALGILHVDTKPVEADSFLAKAIAIISNNPYYYHARAKALLQIKGKFNEAISCYDSAVKYDPGNSVYHLALAQLLEKSENDASALVHYKLAASLDASSAQAFFGVAKLSRYSQPEIAISHINTAISLDAINAEFYYFKALILNELGQNGESLMSLKTSISNEGEKTQSMQELSEIMGGESLRIALMYINRAIELEEKSLYICTRANLLYNVGNISKALSQYELALKLDEKNHEALFGIGRILTDKDPVKALEYLNKAVEIAPKIAYYHAARANILGQDKKKIKEALQAYNLAINIDKQLWQIILQKAKLLDSIGDLLEAQQEYKHVLLVNRNCLDANARMGELLAERGIEAGLSYLDNAILLAPKESIYLIWRALLLYLLGRELEAEKQSREALAMCNGCAQIYYELSKALYKKLPEQTLKYITAAIELDKSNPVYHTLKGDIYGILGEFSNAKKSYEHAIELNPNQHEAIAKYAEILYNEQSPQTLETIEKAVLLDKNNPDYLYIKALTLENLEIQIEQAIECMVFATTQNQNNIKCREKLVELLVKNKNRIRAVLEKGKLQKLIKKHQQAEESISAMTKLELPKEEETPD